tara:strand:+ start:10384 stop:11280 length:897 start_codon:yes stop_codon:yes gene_type:complete
MKILITGANGQLGKEIIISKPANINLIAFSRSQFDLTDKKNFIQIIHQEKPDWIINCAAYTNVDNAESNYELAYTINSLAPKYISETIREIGGKIMHFSTDYVFDGNNKNPYLPECKKAPINVYGETKSMGEDFIKNILFDTNQGFILRTSWLMGLYGNNFALTMLKLFSERDNLNIVSDQFGSPTTTMLLAKACWQLIALDKNNIPVQNILHISNYGVCSWFDIAKEIAEVAKKLNILNCNPNLKPIPSSSYPTPAKRPYYSVLDISSSLNSLSLKKEHWKDGINHLLRELKFRNIV